MCYLVQETHENLESHQGSWLPSQDLKLEPIKCEVGLLTTEPPHLILKSEEC